jgi:hypothetical protein
MNCGSTNTVDSSTAVEKVPSPVNIPAIVHPVGTTSAAVTVPPELLSTIHARIDDIHARFDLFAQLAQEILTIVQAIHTAVYTPPAPPPVEGGK